MMVRLYENWRTSDQLKQTDDISEMATKLQEYQIAFKSLKADYSAKHNEFEAERKRLTNVIDLRNKELA